MRCWTQVLAFRTFFYVSAKELLHKDKPHAGSPSNTTALWGDRGPVEWCSSHFVRGQVRQSLQKHIQVPDLPGTFWPNSFYPAGDFRNGGKLRQSSQLLTVYHKDSRRGQVLWLSYGLNILCSVTLQVTLISCSCFVGRIKSQAGSSWAGSHP